MDCDDGLRAIPRPIAREYEVLDDECESLHEGRNEFNSSY